MVAVTTLGSWHPPDCAEQYYHEAWRNNAELLLCVAIIVTYIPQYIAIWWTSSVVGISSHYILHHALFSTVALCIRIANDIFYDAFNCVNNGTLRGWQATSVLTGYYQVGVQWACAMALVVLFLRRYDWQLHKETEPDPVSPFIIKITVVSVVTVLLPISVLFLWHNDDDWAKQPMGGNLAVYVVELGFFLFPQHVGITFIFSFGQLFYQIRLLKSMKIRGALRIMSAGLLSISFIALAVLQLLRSQPNLDLKWRGPRDVDQISQISYMWFQVSITLGYLTVGTGNLVLFALCWYYDWGSILDRTVGAVRLE